MITISSEWLIIIITIINHYISNWLMMVTVVNPTINQTIWDDVKWLPNGDRDGLCPPKQIEK